MDRLTRLYEEKEREFLATWNDVMEEPPTEMEKMYNRNPGRVLYKHIGRAPTWKGIMIFTLFCFGVYECSDSHYENKRHAQIEEKISCP